MEILDPAYMIGGQEQAVQYAIFPRLAELDLDAEALTWKPSAFVTRLEQVSPTRIEFELRPGMPWSDGSGDVTAEDVKFSYERQLEGDWKKRWSVLDSVEVTGTYSGAVILTEAYAPFMTVTLCSGVGAILCKSAVSALEEGRFTLEPPAAHGPLSH